MRPLCSRTSCSKSKGGALQHTLAATERPLLAKVSLRADGSRSEPDRQRSTAATGRFQASRLDLGQAGRPRSSSTLDGCTRYQTAAETISSPGITRKE
jgi:hypothetical protein